MARPDLGVQELAGLLGLSPSSVSRLLATLESRGYIEQDTVTRRYRLGRSALALGYYFASTSELMVRASPHLEALARQFPIHVHLYGLDRGRVFRYMSLTDTPTVTMCRWNRGMTHTTASGKVLLADMGPEELEATIRLTGLPALSPRSITTMEALRAELAATRQRGYGVDDEETGLGAYCLAAPVRDATGQTIAALSVAGRVSVFRDEQRQLILEVLLTEAAHLSEELGYHPASIPLLATT